MNGPRWPLVVAIVVPPLVIASLLVASFISSNAPREQSGNLWVGTTDYGPASTAPAEDVRAVHDALHDIARRCLEETPDEPDIRFDVDLIVTFAARYPSGRFPVDGETATAPSLLLVTREALKDCAPSEARRISTILLTLP